ncbi:MAG: hypothetical protein K9H64_02470 [Bacteroidales bacterium]|nr:hypothetical protein [Bacteroidales bacterium]MCF8454897.1 hypothetical protein [Bacteroidales bacterium]
MKKQILLTLITLISLSCFAIDPPGLPPLPEAGKPDTILIELSDSTTILIISKSNDEFAGLKSLNLDTLIEALVKVMGSDEFQGISDSLIEFELAQKDFQKAMQAHELALRLKENQFRAQERAMREIENLQDLKQLEQLKAIDAIKELERIKDIEGDKAFNIERDRTSDQINISTNIGLGLIRDKISPSADFVLAFAINKYYYAAIGNMNFTFEQKPDDSYRTQNNIFVGVEFGRRLNKKEDKGLGFSTYFNNVGLSYLVQKRGNYFGENTFKLYYGLDAGPVIIQPQLITTNNFDDWFPSIGIRVKL